MNKKIGYLGPIGTFCELATEKYFGQEKYTSKPYPSIQKVFASVYSREVDVGVVPMENSCEGTVNQTFDLLAYGPPRGSEGEICEYDVKIIGEVIIPIEHSLLARPDVKLEEVSNIISHPQALAQCKYYLEKTFPQAKLTEVNSTAEAVELVSRSNEPWAAIAMATVAEKYGLEILNQGINDYSNNETRFILISKKEEECLTDCKTSILAKTLNQPGALYQILKEFSLRGINLTKIESRPAKTGIGQYLFFIDLDGNHIEPRIKEALDEINTTNPIKILGSYKAAMNNMGRKNELTHSLDNLRRKIDIIDEQIIDLLARRTGLVEQIGKYKSSTASIVHDPTREAWILDKLSTLAEEKGFSSSVTVEIYKILFEHFVAMQKKQ